MASYVPSRGDLVWLQFNPQTGHEKARRIGSVPAEVLEETVGKILALVYPDGARG